jgi:hypothetical protein
VPGVTTQDFLFKGGDIARKPLPASYPNKKSEIDAYDKGMKIKEDSNQFILKIKKLLTIGDNLKMSKYLQVLMPGGNN